MIYSFLIYIISSFLFSFIYPVIDIENYGETTSKWEINSFKEEIYGLKDRINVSASSVAVYNTNNNSFIYEKDSEEILPIASISKLMAALVFLDLDIDWDEYYKIQEGDRRFGGRDYIFLGEEVKRKDLLALAIIASDNTAVSSLISSAGFTEDEFVKMMNDKSRDMGLFRTDFKDATGLNNMNVSTAKEVAIFSSEAFSKNEISSLAVLSEYSFQTKGGRLKNVFSTNKLLFNPDEESLIIIGPGKTGYNNLSGYCLSLNFKIDGDSFVSVVLNSNTINSRFIDSEIIMKEIRNIYNK
ncbi:MAG: serine hydrolase [Patescibacteria group bacterium]